VTTLRDALAPYVDRGDLPGLIALVAHGDDVQVEVIGHRDFGDTEPLARDDIFPIASLSKPIAAAAAMVLVEDGVVALDEPVDALLPELADRQVLRALDVDLDDTVPADTPITVEQLLTCTLGYGVPPALPGTLPIQRAETDLGLMTWGPPWPPHLLTPDEWMARLGRLPLLHQPGETWLYQTGIQVLGVLLERVAKMPLEDVLRERLFTRLGMHDTAFTVPDDKLHRLTTAYAPDWQTGEPSKLDGVEDSWWRTPLPAPPASAWLLSTIDDFWSFARTLRDGGAPVLSQASVRRMTTNALTDAQADAASIFLGSSGWGYGMATHRAGDEGELVRGYGWDGGTGTTWRTDERSGITGILFSQRAMSSPQPPDLFLDFWRAARATFS